DRPAVDVPFEASLRVGQRRRAWAGATVRWPSSRLAGVRSSSAATWRFGSASSTSRTPRPAAGARARARARLARARARALAAAHHVRRAALHMARGDLQVRRPLEHNDRDGGSLAEAD